MIRGVLADTGPLYALADSSDQYHERARQELGRLDNEGSQVLVPYSVLCEAYTLVMRRLGTAYAGKWLDELMAGAVLINPEPGDYSEAANQLARFPDHAITLVDAVTAVLAARIEAPIWAFDRHFETLRAPPPM